MSIAVLGFNLSLTHSKQSIDIVYLDNNLFYFSSIVNILATFFLDFSS